MELESLKTQFDVFGMTYDQYVEGKKKTLFSQMNSPALGKHLETLGMNQIARG
jgi:hypothetical protein